MHDQIHCMIIIHCVLFRIIENHNVEVHHRVIITDPNNNNKMADVNQPRKTYRIYRAQD